MSPQPNDEPTPPRKRSMLGGLRNSFLTGVVVIAPIAMTVWLIWTVVGWVDGFVLPFVPDFYHPDSIVNRILGLEGDDRIEVNIRGVGVVFFLIFTIFVGWIAKGLVGRSFLAWGEGLSQEDVDGDLEWYSGTFKRGMTSPRGICIMQVFNHQTHHRGQVHAMLTAAGASPEDTDIPFMPDAYL